MVVGMKKVIQQYGLLVAAVVLMASPLAALADDGSGAGKLELFMPVVLAILVPLCSLAANFFVVRESDAGWLVALKKVVNACALNLSKNAGQ